MAEVSNDLVQLRCVGQIDAVAKADWDALEHGASPFLRYGFLRALERSGSIGPGTGWHPVYFLAERHEVPKPRLVGAVAAFIKSHSYGEYIFDWAWASAAERAGISYYPKLVVAAPVTPAAGNRILIAADADTDAVTEVLAAGVLDFADRAECSSVHWLFTTEDEQRRLASAGYRARASFQFHWHNRGYESFEDFTRALTSRKRKQVRRERRRVREYLQGIEFVRGDQVSASQLQALDEFYRRTTDNHCAVDYLRPGFFQALAEELPEVFVLACARCEGELIAGALYLETPGALYGRYWGCAQPREFLHFELACYAGIERCIERMIPRFEAGAQGEHKLLRGFVPSPTYSSHWIRDHRLAAPVYEFLKFEAREVTQRMAQLSQYGPYKCEL